MGSPKKFLSSDYSSFRRLSSDLQQSDNKYTTFQIIAPEKDTNNTKSAPLNRTPSTHCKYVRSFFLLAVTLGTSAFFSYLAINAMLSSKEEKSNRDFLFEIGMLIVARLLAISGSTATGWSFHEACNRDSAVSQEQKILHPPISRNPALLEVPVLPDNRALHQTLIENPNGDTLPVRRSSTNYSKYCKGFGLYILCLGAMAAFTYTEIGVMRAATQETNQKYRSDFMTGIFLEALCQFVGISLSALAGWVGRRGSVSVAQPGTFFRLGVRSGSPSPTTDLVVQADQDVNDPTSRSELALD